MTLVSGAPLTIGERLHRARAERPTHTCLIDEHRAWTYETLAHDVGRLAGALAEAGVAPGDRVAILLNTSPGFVLTYLAVAHIGALPVPLDPEASGETLGVILGDCTPSALIGEPDTLARLAALPPVCSVGAVYASQADPARPTLWGRPVGALTTAAKHSGPAPPLAAVDPDDVAVIVYTSGTTDVPKGVMLTHRNLAALISTGVLTLGIGRDDRIGHSLPLFHLYGLREMQITIASGATLVLSTQGAFPASLLKWFGSQGITGFPGVPGQFSLFLGRYRNQLASLGAHLRYILLGTAPTPPELLAALRATLPQTRLFKTYGLTECGRVTTGEFTAPDSPANSVGPPAPGVELTVRDGEGHELPRGQTGRIFISSAMVMKGYWERPRDNVEVLDGNCFKTRDLGSVDEAGRVFLVGRVDEMINTGGEKTAPSEVELVLRRHPAIADAAVVAIPAADGVLGQVPKAFVVVKPGAALEVEDVLKHCARHLEAYKVPRKVVFLSRLPETALGKVRLQTLKRLPE